MTNDNGPSARPKMDHNTARRILGTQQKKRVDLCQRAMEKALQRHNCLVVLGITITGTQIQATIRILPRSA